MSRRWTPEERAAQSALIREQKPWLKSTGPKTMEGKAVSSGNAVTHGMTTRGAKELMAAMSGVSRSLKLLRLGLGRE